MKGLTAGYILFIKYEETANNSTAHAESWFQVTVTSNVCEQAA
jgi:hypothetical protein